MTTIERMEVAAGRTMELRQETINGKSFLSIWYAGDATGEFKKQDERAEAEMLPIWNQYVAHFAATPEKV